MVTKWSSSAQIETVTISMVLNRKHKQKENCAIEYYAMPCNRLKRKINIELEDGITCHEHRAQPAGTCGLVTQPHRRHCVHKFCIFVFFAFSVCIFCLDVASAVLMHWVNLCTTTAVCTSSPCSGELWGVWWLEDPLNFVEIKNPFGSFQSNLMADAWWVPPICFWKKCFSETP